MKFVFLASLAQYVPLVACAVIVLSAYLPALPSCHWVGRYAVI